MILGFKTRFKQPILDGTKIHTIRADKPNRWHAGRKIQMVTGVRTKQFECFKEAQCVSVQKIQITNEEYCVSVLIDGKRIYFDTLEQLAINDGFAGYNPAADFLEFFGKGIFTGKIIHWTNYKY